MPRQKLDRVSLHARVDPQTSEQLKQIAYDLGYIYDKEGSTGQLLDAIASQKQVLVPQSLYLKLVDIFNEMNNNIKCGEKILHTNK
jgi:hypothetical protein